jgi:tetratricopeptide (TPR) repeat protein/DNA-binding CsgD family transcriptional regulator
MFKPLLIASFILLLEGQAAAQSSLQEQQLIHKEDSLLNVLQASKEDTSKMVVLQKLVTLYQDVQPKKTIDWIQQGISIANKLKANDKLLSFYVANIRCNTRQGQFSEALSIAEQSAYLLQKDVQPRTMASYYMQKGLLYFKMSDYVKAAKEYNNAAAIGKQHRLPEVEVKAIMNLGILYDALERYDEMRSHLIAAITIADKQQLEDDKANLQFNLAYLESKVNNYGKAIDYLLAVLPYFEAKGNKTVVATGYANLGWGYYQIKNYTKAVGYSQKSFELRQQMNDLPGIAKLYINLGQIYLEMSKMDSALNNLNKGIELSKKLNIPANLKDGYKALALLQERNQQYKAALESMQSFTQWRDTVYQQDKQKQLLQQLNSYKYQYSDSTSAQNTITAKKQSSIIQWLSIALGITLIGVLGFAIWLFRLKRSAANAALLNSSSLPNATEADQQNLNHLFAERQKLEAEIINLKSEIRQLEFGLKNQTREDLESLRKLVGNSKLQTEGYWNEFLLLFSKVYPNFFEQLKIQFPQLSQNELRICALMKLNLSLLEISNLLNIAPESVRKARYRMYKKMNLESDQQLADTMLTF